MHEEQLRGHFGMTLEREQIGPVRPPETRNPKPRSRNPKPGTRKPRPETQKSKTETRGPKTENRNPKQESRNPRPSIRNLEPETRHPKTENRKPEIRNQKVGMPRFDVSWFCKHSRNQDLCACGDGVACGSAVIATQWISSVSFPSILRGT